ncbi:MAG: hypothetical protein ACM34A_07135 [Bacillota bacterium]
MASAGIRAAVASTGGNLARPLQIGKHFRLTLARLGGLARRTVGGAGLLCFPMYLARRGALRIFELAVLGASLFGRILVFRMRCHGISFKKEASEPSTPLVFAPSIRFHVDEAAACRRQRPALVIAPRYRDDFFLKHIPLFFMQFHKKIRKFL